MTIGVAFSLPSTADSFLFSIVAATSAQSRPISATLSRRPTDDQKLFLFASCSLSRNVRPPGPLFLHPHALHAHSLSTLHDRWHTPSYTSVCVLATQPGRSALDGLPASSWRVHVHLLLYKDIQGQGDSSPPKSPRDAQRD